MMELYDVFVGISGFCVLLVPIISVGSAFIPPFKKFIQCKIRELLGIEQLSKKIEENQENLVALSERIELIEQAVNNHIDDGQKRLETDRSVLRSSLIRSFIFYLDRGYITMEELEVLQMEYNQYVSIDGNGVIKYKWENEILKLKNIPPEERN